MTTWQIILIVAIFVAMDAAVVGAVFTMAAQAVAPLADAFPARTPTTDAVRRNFQSFKIDAVNLGLSIHVAADEECLHLYPTWIARRLGMKPMSIPWGAIQIEESSRPSRSTKRARIGKSRVLGPRWCMELAGRGAPDRV